MSIARSHSSRIAALARIILFVAPLSCADPPSAPRPSAPISLGENLVINPAVRRGPQRSAFIYYRSSAPPNRLFMIADSGFASSAGEIDGQRLIAAVIHPQRYLHLRNFPWVDSVVLGTDEARIGTDTIPWGVDTIDADLVHSQVLSEGSGVKVAVLDNGTDCSQADLAPRIAGGVDFIGTNHCRSTALHGTGVAGIIAATRNSTGLLGVAPAASLYSVRVCDDNEDCYDAAIANGFQWAATNQMHVVNFSIFNCGATPVFGVRLAMANAVSAGVTIAAIAGNGSSSDSCGATDPVSGYAREPNVIAVAAHHDNFSYPGNYQYGPAVDISAPHCVPTVLYSNFCGTSAAAPHVAGAAALLVSAGFSGPTLIAQRLTQTAYDRGTTGKDDYYGWGTLRARHAVVLRPSVSIDGPGHPITSAGSYTFTATVSNGAGPFGIKWVYDRSDTPQNPDDATGYGSASYTVELSHGDYSITLTATPKETTWGRIGFGSTIFRSVCTELAVGIMTARGPVVRPPRRPERREPELPFTPQPRPTDYGCGGSQDP